MEVGQVVEDGLRGGAVVEVAELLDARPTPFGGIPDGVGDDVVPEVAEFGAHAVTGGLHEEAVDVVVEEVVDVGADGAQVREGEVVACEVGVIVPDQMSLQMAFQLARSSQNSRFLGQSGSLIGWSVQHSILQSWIWTLWRGRMVFGGLRVCQ